MKKILINTFFSFILISLGSFVNAQEMQPQIQMNTELKHNLISETYQSTPKTNMCECQLNFSVKNQDSINISNADITQCSYQARRNDIDKTEVKIIPVITERDIYRSQALCQNQNGNCPNTDQLLNLKYDLYNSIVLMKEIADTVENKRYTQLSEEYATQPFGQCDIKVDYNSSLVEPTSYAKGYIARIFLYAHQIYGYYLAPYEKDKFDEWNINYPVTDIEYNLNKVYGSAQKVKNPFIN